MVDRSSIEIQIDWREQVQKAKKGDRWALNGLRCVLNDLIVEGIPDELLIVWHEALLEYRSKQIESQS